VRPDNSRERHKKKDSISSPVFFKTALERHSSLEDTGIKSLRDIVKPHPSNFPAAEKSQSNELQSKELFVDCNINELSEINKMSKNIQDRVQTHGQSKDILKIGTMEVNTRLEKSNRDILNNLPHKHNDVITSKDQEVKENNSEDTLKENNTNSGTPDIIPKVNNVIDTPLNPLQAIAVDSNNKNGHKTKSAKIPNTTNAALKEPYRQGIPSTSFSCGNKLLSFTKTCPKIEIKLKSSSTSNTKLTLGIMSGVPEFVLFSFKVSSELFSLTS
jgi:hypothetical protein